MLSEQGQMIKNWLFQFVKNAPPTSTVIEARGNLEKLAGDKLPEGVAVESVTEKDVNGEWVSAGPVHAGKAVIYFHGGGFIMGSLKSGRGLAISISQAAQCPVFSVDYQLAPEHPFPAALDDAVAAYHWLLRTGLRPENIVFAGDSAGGGLALAAITVLKNAGEKFPAGAVLITPWLDLLGTSDSRQTKQESDPWYNPGSIELKAGELYAGGNNMANPLISPLYADLTSFPPLFLQAAGDDTLLDDSIRLYEKWKASGVDITLELWEDMWHVWHHFADTVPEARQAMNNLGVFIKKRLGIDG